MIPKPDPKLSRHAKGGSPANDFLRDSFGKPDPMPDDRPESPERCSKRRQGDGKQCVRPTGHPGDCAASWASTTADFGHDDPGAATTKEGR